MARRNENRVAVFRSIPTTMPPRIVAADREYTFILSGQGDLLEADDGVVGIGSGGAYALAAARALMAHTKLSASEIAQESLKIAAQICVYTNEQITVETL